MCPEKKLTQNRAAGEHVGVSFFPDTVYKCVHDLFSEDKFVCHQRRIISQRCRLDVIIKKIVEERQSSGEGFVSDGWITMHSERKLLTNAVSH